MANSFSALQGLTFWAGWLCLTLRCFGSIPEKTGIALPNFASISNHFDSLARMDFTGLQNDWGHILVGYGYSMDNLGLRTNITRNLGLTTNSVAVGYDNIGQLISWDGKEASGAL